VHLVEQPDTYVLGLCTAKDTHLVYKYASVPRQHIYINLFV